MIIAAAMFEDIHHIITLPAQQMRLVKNCKDYMVRKLTIGLMQTQENNSRTKTHVMLVVNLQFAVCKRILYLFQYN